MPGVHVWWYITKKNSLGLTSRGVGVGEVDETHLDGTRGCAGAMAVQK